MAGDGPQVLAAMRHGRARHVALMGFMASGKSSVGPALARHLGCPFVDLDQAIVAETGLSIPELFAQHGEPGFRDQESQTLLRILSGPGSTVLALGGGAVLREANRRALQQTHAFVVWLQATLATVTERLLGSSGRPLLDGKPPDAWRALYEERMLVYAAAPYDLAVTTDHRPPEDIAGEIAMALDNFDDPVME